MYEIVSSSRTEHFLFLEDDWVLPFSRSTPPRPPRPPLLDLKLFLQRDLASCDGRRDEVDSGGELPLLSYPILLPSLPPLFLLLLLLHLVFRRFLLPPPSPPSAAFTLHSSSSLSPPCSVALSIVPLLQGRADVVRLKSDELSPQSEHHDGL